jgi:hypothetical protein
MKQDIKLKLEGAEGREHCPAHKPLVEVLLSFEKRLTRIEWLLALAAASALGTFGKAVIWPALAALVKGG